MAISKGMLFRMYSLFSLRDEITREKLEKIGFLKTDIEELFQRGYLERSVSGAYALASLKENETVRRELLEEGFATSEVEKLIKNEYLEKVRRDVYSFKDRRKLAYYYDVHLSDDVNSDDFFELLERCYDLDPDNTKLARTLLYEKLKNGDFGEDVYKYFEATDLDPTDKINNNLLLFLMQYVTTLPRKYGLRVIHLDEGSLMIDDEDEEKRDFINGLRFIIFNEDFEEALYRYWGKGPDWYQQVVRSLLKRIDVEMAKSKTDIYGMIVLECDYRKAYASFLKKKQKRQLFDFERTVMKMAEDIIKLDNGYEINRHESYDLTFSAEVFHRYHNPNLGKAVFSGNYDLVYRILGMSHNNSDDRVKIFNTLLDEIVKRDPDIFYRVVLSDFGDGNFVNALEDVKRYLGVINASKYGNYVNNLIKLAVINGDKIFTEAASVISKLRDGERSFDPTNYIPDFSAAISDGDIAKASVYRNLIVESKTLGGPEVDKEFFNKTLEDAEANKDETIVDSANIGVDKDLVLLSLSDVISSVKETKGLRILERLDEDTQSEVMNVLAKVPNIKALVVDGRVTLRYVDLEVEKSKVSYRRLISLAYEAFNNERYDAAIARLSNACSKIGTPDVKLYKALGLSYMGRGSSKDDYDRALDYFYVAQAGGQYVEPYIKMTKEKTCYNGTKVTQYVKQ